MPKKKIEKPEVSELTSTPDIEENILVPPPDGVESLDNAGIPEMPEGLDDSDSIPGNLPDEETVASDDEIPELPEPSADISVEEAAPDEPPADLPVEEPPAELPVEEVTSAESPAEPAVEEFAADEPPAELPVDEPPVEAIAAADPDESYAAPPAKAQKPKPVPARKKTIYDLKLNALDRDLSPEEQQEWSSIYASYRSKSILTGTVIGADQNTFDMRNKESGELETKTLSSLIIIDYRVKVLIPESEMWMPGEERPSHVLRNMTGSQIDYVILEVDREGECAIGSRRMALAAKRHFFATARGGHTEGDLLKCRVIATGPHKCTVECNGYDVQLSQRDLSYTTMPDLRVKYHPGQELACRLKAYDREAAKLIISVKEANPNPFAGASKRHPVGSRRQAVISGKYAGGVFCTLPDDTVCLCLYSARHSDMDFGIGDGVIVVIRQYDYGRELIYGRILAKW